MTPVPGYNDVETGFVCGELFRRKQRVRFLSPACGR